MTILKALALPAASVPPIKVAIVNLSEGSPSLAKTIAGKVVTRSNSTTLNFINSR
jgi:hypothetical protein